MSNNECSACYYYDVCQNNEICDDFMSIINESDDETIEEMIEQRREEYRAAWDEYISEYQN